MRVSSKYGPIYKSFCRFDLVAGMVDDVEDIVVAIDAISGKAIDDCVDGLIIECDLFGNGIDNDVINRFWRFDIIVVGSIWFCSKLVDFDKFGPMVEVDSIGVVMVSNNQRDKEKNVNAFEKRDIWNDDLNFEFVWMLGPVFGSAWIQKKRNWIRNI